MTNYGETVAYWYLRLNGFFPLTRFVLHRNEETIAHSADCDLLAIRMPHTYEVVGGNKIDWDNDRFEEWGLDLANDPMDVHPVFWTLFSTWNCDSTTSATAS